MKAVVNMQRPAGSLARAYTREWIRPWKLVTFAASMAWLLWGAVHFEVSDWDIGVTLLIGPLTYLTAPWSLALILVALRYRPRHWPWHMAFGLGMGLLITDAAYVAYHTIAQNRMLRWDNFVTAYPLYYLAGACWLYRGSLRELVRGIRYASSQ